MNERGDAAPAATLSGADTAASASTPAPVATAAPEVTVVAVASRPFTAVPTLAFTLEVTVPEAFPVYTIALTCQVNLDPARRRYDDDARAKLEDLFGAPERWAATTRSLLWFQQDVLVGSFRGRTRAELVVPCSYDMEIAATKYLYSLADGEAPLTFHFSGSVFYQAADGRLQIVKVPWDRHARFGLPVAVWQEMMAQHYPGGAWMRLDRETLDRLRALQTRRGLVSLDAAVAELLSAEEDDGDGASVATDTPEVLS